MFKKSVLVGMFVAAVMVVPLGGIANAAKGEKAPSFACSFMQDIHKVAEAQVNVEECLKCLCLFNGSTQFGWKVVFFWEGELVDVDEEFRCDDGTEQACFARVTGTRFVRVLPGGCDPLGVSASQCDCIRGKEDLFVQIYDCPASITPLTFSGSGIGVVGVGLVHKDEDCCNLDENQAILHLKGSKFRHDKKKCWARLKLFSRINPLDRDVELDFDKSFDGPGGGPGLDPCDINGQVGDFEFNGMEGCLCNTRTISVD